MNPSNNTKDTSSFNLLTYFKWRRRDTDSVGDSSAKSEAESGSASGNKKDLEEKKPSTITEIPLTRQIQDTKQFELSYSDGKQPQRQMNIASDMNNTTHLSSQSSHSPESAFFHARRLGEKIMDRIIIPDIMPNDCENIQTRSRFKTCVLANNRGVQLPQREKRTTVIQSMISNNYDTNNEFIQITQKRDIVKDRQRCKSEIIGISQEINEYYQKNLRKRAISADSFIKLKQTKKTVKISHWGVHLEGQLAAARRGFSSTVLSANAQAEMMTKFKEISVKQVSPDKQLKSQCQIDIYKLFRHRESLRRIAGDSLKHDGNKVQFKECCLSGKCQGIHVNPFKSMSDQQFLCRGFQAEEIYAKILINSHDLLINSSQLLNQFIQFAFINEKFSFNRLYKALEFVLCWIKYRSRTFYTNPVMMGRIQAFVEILSMKYPPRNEQSIPLNRCCQLNKVPQANNEVICRCKDFLFGQKQLQERPRVNSSNCFLDASQDSTSVVQQCPITNHQQKKRGPPAAAVRALAHSNISTKNGMSNSGVKPCHQANKSSIEGLSQLLEKPNLTRQVKSEQKQNKAASQQCIQSDNYIENQNILECSTSSTSTGIPLRKQSTVGAAAHPTDFNNPQFSSVSSSSQNYRTSLFATGNSHFTNQLSTRDSLADIIIITPISSSQSSSKKGKIMGNENRATLTTTNSGDISAKTILTDKILTGNTESLNRNSIISQSQLDQQYFRTRGLTIQELIPQNQYVDGKLTSAATSARRYTEYITPIQEEWQTTQKDESFLEEHQIYEFNLEKQTIKEEQLDDTSESDWKIRQHQQKLMVSSGLRTSEEISQSNIQDQIIREQFIEQQSELLEMMQSEENGKVIDRSDSESRMKVIQENRTFSRVGMTFQGEILLNNDNICTNCTRFNNNSKNENGLTSQQMNQNQDQTTYQISIEEAKRQKQLKDEQSKQILLSCKIFEIQQELQNISKPNNNPFCSSLDNILIEQLKSSWQVEGMLRSEERLNRSLDNFKFSKDIFLVVDPAVLTQQLCLIDHQLFKNIQIQEFFSDKRLKTLQIFKQFSQRTNLNALRERINVFTYYLVLLILVQNSDRDRVSLLERILQISEWSIQYQNFCMTLSIYFLFNSTNLMLVLPQLVKKLQLHPQQQLKDLENTIQFSKSFNNLKCLMLNAQPPLIPALNILTRDMTLVDQQMSDYVTLDDAQFLNLDKFEIVAQVANVFYKAQSHDYPFVLRPSLYCFFKDQFKLFMGKYININDSKAIDAQLQTLAEQLINRKG